MESMPDRDVVTPDWERSPRSASDSLDHYAEDLRLIQQARAGAEDAIGRFVERMACIPRILAAKNARLGKPLNDDELADLCQETFSILWSKAHTYAGKAKLETWAARFCLFVLMNNVRGRRRRGRSLRSDPAVPADAETRIQRQDLRQELCAALQQLPSENADIIQWRLLDQISFEDIAERLSAPLNTVKTRYYRGMERLRKLLRSGGEEGP
jgi:RNA polymerase sigma-70 factor (ECF subfamily)